MSLQNKKYKILLVEDDINLSFVIKDNLEYQGFEVHLFENGELGYEAFVKEKFDICVFDIMLPKEDGLTLAKKVREMDKEVPIIFLTAKSMKEDKINAFLLGADDYITKPFNIEELILRLKVFLKRSGKESVNEPRVMVLNEFVFDYPNLELIHKNQCRRITQRQADLLKVLFEHQGKMIKREDLLKSVWGSDDYFAGRSMDVFISKLRKFLSADKGIEIINYHGIGFKLTMARPNS